MKFSVLQENLAKSLSLASRFASTRAQLPILGNILLTADKSKLKISSTNLEISVSSIVGAKIDEVGEISIPAKTITDIVSNLPKETIELSLDKEQLKISTSGFSSKLMGMNASDFPKIPTTISRDKAAVLNREDLVRSLSKIIFATGIDETRPILTGVLFIFGKGELTLVATDGFRLSRVLLKSQSLQKSQSLVIPKGILNELVRVSETATEILMEPQEKDKQVVFGIEETILSSRLLEGDYPDYEKILPKATQTTVLGDKEEFLRAVKLASVFAREASNIVKIKVLKDSTKVLAESGSSGSQETKVDAKINGPEVEISFNYRFLEEFLHSVSGGEVKMEFTTPDKAGVFTDSSDRDYLHLIMPVKVQG